MPVFEIESSDHPKQREIEIIDYLNKHPEFLVENADRIHLLNDFKYNIFHLARKYREENQHLHRMMEGFLQVAEKNFQLLITLSEMNRIIRHSTRIEHVIPYVIDFFKDKFGIDAISLCWDEQSLPLDSRRGIMKSLRSARENHFMFVNPERFKVHRGLLHKPIVKQRRCAFLTHFFPPAALLSIHSAVVIPLRFQNRIMGCLSLGCRDRHRFHPGQSYDFIMGTADNIAAGLNLMVLRQFIHQHPEQILPAQFRHLISLIRQNTLPGETLQLFEIMLPSGQPFPDIRTLQHHFHRDDIFYSLPPDRLIYIPNHHCPDPLNIKQKLAHYLKDLQPAIQFYRNDEFLNNAPA
ncbi:MAG: DUF484 family protein [Candidatus Delongbacteria bacterium]|nr:DUF484 family protein [Candidatus Delongbacteria bacterium]